MSAPGLSAFRAQQLLAAEAQQKQLIHLKEEALRLQQEQQQKSQPAQPSFVAAPRANGHSKTQPKGVPRLLAEAQDALAAKTAHFQHAVNEQDRLKARLRVLDIVLPALEQQVNALRAAQANYGPSVTIRQLSDNADSASPTSSGDTLETLKQRDVHELLADSSFVLPTNGSSVADMPEGQVIRSASVTALVAREQSNEKFSNHMNGFNQLLKETVEKLAVHLCAYDVHPSQTQHLQWVEHHLAAFRNKLRELVLVEPNFWIMATSRNQETGENKLAPTSHWREAAATMHVTPRQMRDVEAVLDLYDEQTSGLMEERASLMAQLSALLEPHGDPAFHNFVDFENAVAIDDVMLAVDKNLSRERAARHVLSTFVGAPGIFSLHQIARAYVGSWPYMVDVVEICRAMVELQQSGSSGSGSSGNTGHHHPRQQLVTQGGCAAGGATKMEES